MKIVSINNLKPGMVISEDVFSYHGQCLAKQNTPVTLQLIEHLKFYQIALSAFSLKIMVTAIQAP